MIDSRIDDECIRIDLASFFHVLGVEGWRQKERETDKDMESETRGGKRENEGGREKTKKREFVAHCN